jgi:DinB superfamily
MDPLNDLADLRLFRTVREATLQLTAGLTESQAAYLPGPGKWSIGEVLDHILLAEKLYRDRFTKLIELKNAGQRPELKSDFSEINTSILFIPKPILPFLEAPFKMMNLFIPTAVREAMTRYRVMPAQAPSIALPRKGRPIAELREELRCAVERTEELFRSNPDLDYRELRLSHPLMGNNNVLQLVRVMSMHEQRHQRQIRTVQRAPLYPK